MLGTYRGPWDILMSGAFYYTSGQTFTRTVRVSAAAGTDGPVHRTARQPAIRCSTQLDIRLEKQFRLRSDRRLGLTFEGFNLFNADTITSRTTRSGSSYFTPHGPHRPAALPLGAIYRF